MTFAPSSRSIWAVVLLLRFGELLASSEPKGGASSKLELNVSGTSPYARSESSRAAWPQSSPTRTSMPPACPSAAPRRPPNGSSRRSLEFQMQRGRRATEGSDVLAAATLPAVRRKSPGFLVLQGLKLVTFARPRRQAGLHRADMLR